MTGKLHRIITFTIGSLGLLLLALYSGHVTAQYGSFGLTDARQLALGNTYTTNSRELYAAGKNPALLANTRYDRKISFLFPNLSAWTYNILALDDFLTEYFSGRPLEIIINLDKQFLQKALASNGKLSLGMQIGYIAGAYKPSEKIGTFSLAIKDYLSGFLSLPKGFVRVNDTQEPLDHGIGFSDFRFNSSWIRAYELSYGRAFPINGVSGIKMIYAGLGVKYYNGYLYNEIDLLGGLGYSTEDKLIQGTYEAEMKYAFSDDISVRDAFDAEEKAISNVPFMKPVGRGLGLDIGIVAWIGNGVLAGISVIDVGRITWKGNTRTTYAKGSISVDSILTDLSIDSILNAVSIIRENESSFKSSPPAALHLGFGVQLHHYLLRLPGEMNLSIEMHQGLNDALGNLANPRLAFGLDWKPGIKWPVILTGLSNDHDQGFNWALGLGYELSFAEIYLSSPDLISFFTAEDMQSLSFSICWHFVKSKREKKVITDNE
jgi:hypothetical protein